jgi:hypothetical protein
MEMQMKSNGDLEIMKGRRPRRFVAVVAALALVGWTVGGTGAAVRGQAESAMNAQLAAGELPTIGVEDVHVGQRGYGLSVFNGGAAERFDVEVIGVWRNTSPDMNYIIARLTGHGLEGTGVVAGMSGSPVFLDGRLAGAVAFGWPFAKDAICGVTPIASMRRLSTIGGTLPTTTPPPVALATLLKGQGTADLLSKELSRLRPHLGGLPDGVTSSIEWAASGFGDASTGLLRQAFGPLTLAGRMASGGLTATGAPAMPGPGASAAGTKSSRAPAADSQLAPGSAVAAVLVDGDFQLAGTGTVTDRVGDHIFAFGHPLLGLGPIHVPMASADVLTVLSSQYSSFKIANLGSEVGTFVQDRQAGIMGTVGPVAAMVPLRLHITAPGLPGEAGRTFNVRIAKIPEMLPTLAGSTLVAGLESASYNVGPQSLDLTAHLDLSNRRHLDIVQSFDGETATAAAGGYLVALAAYVGSNPFEKVEIEKIDVDLRQLPQPQVASLVGAHAERSVVRPGQKIRLDVDFVAYRGGPFRHTVNWQVPQDLQPGRYSLLIGDGASADAARFSLEPPDPLNFNQALEVLGSLHSRRDLAVLGLYPAPGLAVAGEIMPRLPGSVRSLWGAAPTGAAAPLRMTIAEQRYERLDQPIDGLVRVDLEVRRREEVKTASPLHPDGVKPGAPSDPDGGASSDQGSDGNEGNS